jgi:prepilin-type N-terminal cleavage/methylation domain-containing protein
MMKKMWNAECGMRKWADSRPNAARDAGGLLSALRSPLPGFTLIELLVVIAIIAILAGLVLQTAGFVQRKGATSRAEAEVAALSAALESYKADMGDYPLGTNNAGAANFNLLTNLMPTAAGTKVYFEVNKGMTNSAGFLTDPFGTTYGYQYYGNATRSGTNFFDLWSTAGSTNTNAWIKNW